MIDKVIVLFQLIFLFLIFIAGSVDVYFNLPRFETHPTLHWIAMALVAVSLIYMAMGALKLGKYARVQPKPARNAPLRTTGPFAYTRHPMYTSMIVGSVFWTLYLGSYFALASSLLLFAILIIKAKKEESYLLNIFGEDYKKYMGRVGRFSPKLCCKH